MRNGDNYTRLAAGFSIGVATPWRYIEEATVLLSTTIRAANHVPAATTGKDARGGPTPSESDR